MKIVLVYPLYPDTFWSFKHALKFVSKKATFPPLGLLTVASMLPKEWEKRVIDMNAVRLRDEDILWADYVFISAMSIQSASANLVIERCIEHGTKIVAGGPLFTSSSNIMIALTILSSTRRKSRFRVFSMTLLREEQCTNMSPTNGRTLPRHPCLLGI